MKIACSVLLIIVLIYFSFRKKPDMDEEYEKYNMD